MELMSGLPDEITRECLVRISYNDFHLIQSVCRLWREEIESPFFHRFRRSAGLTTAVIAMAQAKPPPSPTKQSKEKTSMQLPSYHLALYEPSTGAWTTLPPIPGLTHGLPIFCYIASAATCLAVVGGWDPSTWVASNSIFLYDFLSATWRRGSRMPGPRRSFFACASDLDRTIFVAGGHDEEKNALRSAMAYDVKEDTWVRLPDMEQQRDECKGVFYDRRFTVLGGYSTEHQGQFGTSSESFDTSTWRWDPEEKDTLEVGSCPRTCVVTNGGKLYRCREGKVEVKVDQGSKWAAVAEVPEEVKVAPWVVAVDEEGVMVVGSKCHGGMHEMYMLNLEKGEWRKAEVPEEHSGHVQAGCCLYI